MKLDGDKMNLGNSLFKGRKRSRLSQENVAEKLGVSRQTISKWETNETVPDISQAKRLAKLYRMSLNALIDFDEDVEAVEEAIKNTNENLNEKIDWTNAWGKKYPVLVTYTKVVDVQKYASFIRQMLDELKMTYNYNELDSMLVLKDILYHEWKDNK